MHRRCQYIHNQPASPQLTCLKGSSNFHQNLSILICTKTVSRGRAAIAKLYLAIAQIRLYVYIYRQRRT